MRLTEHERTALRQILDAARDEYERSGHQRWAYFTDEGWAGRLLWDVLLRSAIDHARESV